MSTENEAGSPQPAAESAATGHEGAAPAGASAAPVPPPAPQAPPAAPSVPSADPRTEVLPVQAPPPVGPPSPYGPPPREVTDAPGGSSMGGGSPYGASNPVGGSPYGAGGGSPYEASNSAGGGSPYEAPKPSPYEPHAPQPAVFAAEPHAQDSTPDPYAVPATPAYASGAPQLEHGYGGAGGGGPVWGAPVPVPPNDGRRRGGLAGLVAAVVVAALAAGGVGGGIGYEVAKHNNDSSSTTVTAASNPKTLNRAPTSVAGIASKALPSVVTIKASGSQESGTGTGFVYDTQGHILTNNHVVAPAADGGKLTVTFSNGNTYNAEVIGRAQGYDVAVIKLKNAGGVKLTPLPLGNSDDTQVGDATIAIGAPFGLSGTVTTGIVSAVHRPVASSDGQGSSASYMSAIQTDASINPGNSGGPLMNANGAVIGINSAIQPAGNSSPGSQGGSVGLGFAIPINQAKRVADQLIRTGQPVYPLIGVSLDTQYDGDGAKISTDSGTAITPGGPGAKAGLKPGDVITKFDSTLIDSGQTLIGEIWQHSPGDKATLTYTRDGSTHTTSLTLGSRTGDSTD